MATDSFVPKDALIARLQEMARRRESGLVTIVTDSRASVMLKISEGSIVGARARTRDIAAAVERLLECQAVRFAYAPVPVVDLEDTPAIMPLNDFIGLIEPGAEVSLRSDTAPTHRRETGAHDTAEKGIDEAHRYSGPLRG